MTVTRSHIIKGFASSKPNYARTSPPYRIAVDPDHSWGYDTVLAYSRIVDLAQQHHLAEGTVFDNGVFTASIVDGVLVKKRKEIKEGKDNGRT